MQKLVISSCASRASHRSADARPCRREVQGLLADRGQHRGASVPDLIVAVAANRGVPARARTAPLLRKGHVYRTSVYRCSLKKTDVRCTNGVRHGFQIGKDAIFRF